MPNIPHFQHYRPDRSRETAGSDGDDDARLNVPAELGSGGIDKVMEDKSVGVKEKVDGYFVVIESPVRVRNAAFRVRLAGVLGMAAALGGLCLAGATVVRKADYMEKHRPEVEARRIRDAALYATDVSTLDEKSLDTTFERILRNRLRDHHTFGGLSDDELAIIREKLEEIEQRRERRERSRKWAAEMEERDRVAQEVRESGAKNVLLKDAFLTVDFNNFIGMLDDKVVREEAVPIPGGFIFNHYFYAFEDYSLSPGEQKMLAAQLETLKREVLGPNQPYEVR